MTIYTKHVRHNLGVGFEGSGLNVFDSGVIQKELSRASSDDLVITDSPSGWSLAQRNSDTLAVLHGGTYMCLKEGGVVLVGISTEPEPPAIPDPPGLPGGPTVGDDTIDTVDNVLPEMPGCGFTPLQFCQFACTRKYSGTKTTAMSSGVTGTIVRISGNDLTLNGRIISFGTGLLTYTVVSSALNGANTDLTITPALLTAVPNTTTVYLLSPVNVRGTQFGSAADNSIAVATNQSFDGTTWRFGASRPEMQTINIKLILESTAKRDEFISFIMDTAGYVIQIVSNLNGETPIYCNLNSRIIEFTKIAGDSACSVWSTEVSFIRKIQ